MNVLLTGASGQIGKELIYTSPQDINLVVLDKYSLDITSQDDVKETFKKYEPDVVINAAAITSVENAEVEKGLAYEVNRNGVKNIAIACNESNAKLIHYSTDYVFDGKKSSPYTLIDKPNPINVYGQSKAEGEKEALIINNANVIIIRTSWVYSKHGNNFFNTILDLINRKDRIEIIADQTGTPTWARSVADITWHFMRHPEVKGIFHFSDDGSTNWFEFAKAIQDEAFNYSILNETAEIIPIETKDYQSNVKRPSYSVLDCNKTFDLLNLKPDNWRIALKKMIQDYNQ